MATAVDRVAPGSQIQAPEENEEKKGMFGKMGSMMSEGGEKVVYWLDRNIEGPVAQAAFFGLLIPLTGLLLYGVVQGAMGGVTGAGGGAAITAASATSPLAIITYSGIGIAALGAVSFGLMKAGGVNEKFKKYALYIAAFGGFLAAVGIVGSSLNKKNTFDFSGFDPSQYMMMTLLSGVVGGGIVIAIDTLCGENEKARKRVKQIATVALPIIYSALLSMIVIKFLAATASVPGAGKMTNAQNWAKMILPLGAVFVLASVVFQKTIEGVQQHFTDDYEVLDYRQMQEMKRVLRQEQRYKEIEYRRLVSEQRARERGILETAF